MPSAPAHRRMVVVEILAICPVAPHTIAWFALIVGVHFLSDGRASWIGFYILGIGRIVVRSPVRSSVLRADLRLRSTLSPG